MLKLCLSRIYYPEIAEKGHEEFCEKVILVSENYITYPIGKFMLDMPSPGNF